MNGTRTATMINGVLPSWSNLAVVVAGVAVNGINKIDYSDKQSMDNIYGIGQRPIGRGYGRIECAATIGLERSEIEALRAASDTGRLQDIAPFDIIVQFIPAGGTIITTHKILGCQFKDDDLSLSEGDTSNYTDCELIVSEIVWN